MTISLEKSRQRREPVEQLRGTLVAAGGFAPDGAPAIAIDVPVHEALPASAPRAAAATSAAAGSAWLAIGLALLGGLLLNLMPCVFPILSIKALALAAPGHANARTLRIEGVAYGAGVVVTFVALAGLLLATWPERFSSGASARSS